jgi:predicted aminopeptidase
MMTLIEDDGMPNIGAMSDEEMVSELLAQQEAIIRRMDRHTMAHQIVRVRTQEYMNRLFADAGCNAEEEGIPNIGQYL